MTLLSAAEAYYEANKAAVDSLVEELRSSGVEEWQLDDIAHEAADEVEASELNNSGLVYQVASAIEGNGLEEGRKIILEAVGTATSPRP